MMSFIIKENEGSWHSRLSHSVLFLPLAAWQSVKRTETKTVCCVPSMPLKYCKCCTQYVKSTNYNAAYFPANIKNSKLNSHLLNLKVPGCAMIYIRVITFYFRSEVIMYDQENHIIRDGIQRLTWLVIESNISYRKILFLQNYVLKLRNGWIYFRKFWFRRNICRNYTFLTHLKEADEINMRNFGEFYMQNQTISMVVSVLIFHTQSCDVESVREIVYKVIYILYSYRKSYDIFGKTSFRSNMSWYTGMWHPTRHTTTVRFWQIKCHDDMYTSKWQLMTSYLMSELTQPKLTLIVKILQLLTIFSLNWVDPVSKLSTAPGPNYLSHFQLENSNKITFWHRMMKCVLRMWFKPDKMYLRISENQKKWSGVTPWTLVWPESRPQSPRSVVVYPCVSVMFSFPLITENSQKVPSRFRPNLSRNKFSANFQWIFWDSQRFYLWIFVEISGVQIELQRCRCTYLRNGFTLATDHTSHQIMMATEIFRGRVILYICS